MKNGTMTDYGTNDTIRWCYTHGTEAAWKRDSCMNDLAPLGVCDVADALVIRTDQPMYRLHADLFNYDREIADMMADGVLVRIGAET